MLHACCAGDVEVSALILMERHLLCSSAPVDTRHDASSVTVSRALRVIGITGVADFMGQVGVPLPTAAAIVVTGVETLCGLALVVGFFTRWAAIPLAINMLVAAVIVHQPAGFFLPNGYEYALTLLAACASLSLLGSGAYAVESLLIGRGDSPTTDVRAGAPKAA